MYRVQQIVQEDGINAKKHTKVHLRFIVKSENYGLEVRVVAI